MGEKWKPAIVTKNANEPRSYLVQTLEGVRKEKYEWCLKEEEDEIEVEPSPPNERNSGEEQSIKQEEIEQFKNIEMIKHLTIY